MIPDWWEAVLLVGGSYRLWRLFAVEKITERWRDWLFKTEVIGTKREGEYREWVDTLVSCPWCLGTWIVTVTWILWLALPYAVLVVCGLLTAMVGVGLLGARDEEHT